MGILDVFYPKRCAGCGKTGTYFCPSCALASRPHLPQVCPVCEKAAPGGITHARCRKEFASDGLFIVWRYEGAPKKLIKKLKYRYVSDLAKALARAAAANLTLAGKFVLVPIPLHWARKNWRGFNHTEEVGKLLAQMLGWKMLPLLERQRWTTPQVGLASKERRENVKGAFMISRQLTTNNSQPILLFDDVWTSGSTMREAVKVLKKAGFQRVWCLTLAR